MTSLFGFEIQVNEFAPTCGDCGNRAWFVTEKGMLCVRCGSKPPGVRVERVVCDGETLTKLSTEFTRKVQRYGP